MKLHSEREMLGRNREESLKPNVKLDMSQRTHYGRRQGISGSLAHSWMEWFQANYENSKFGNSTSYTETSSTYDRIWGVRKLVCGQNFFLYNFNNCWVLVFRKGLFIFICLSAVVGLRCCGWAFSSCGKQALLSAPVQGFSRGWFLLWKQAQKSRHTGLVALWHEGSQTKDWTSAPCIGRQILNHRTTWKASTPSSF